MDFSAKNASMKSGLDLPACRSIIDSFMAQYTICSVKKCPQLNEFQLGAMQFCPFFRQEVPVSFSH